MRQERLIDAALSTSLRSGKSSAGNLGISLAHGEIIVMADCDSTFDRDAIRHLIAPFDDPAVGAVSGNVGVRNSRGTLLSAMQGVEYLLSISMGKRVLDLFDQVTCASGAFSAFRRRALAQVAGHDVGPGEDLDLTLRLRRAGWKVRFAEDAWCLTDVPETFVDFVRQRLRWERDSLRLRMRKHRRGIYRRDGREGSHELLHHVEFVIFHLVATFAFYVYLIWLSYWLGTAAITVLVLAGIIYILLDLIAVACVLIIVDRAEVRRLVPYAFLYGFFQTYMIRTVRVIAYVQEWVFVSSRRDWYVPARVANRTPYY
jgi:cellulose synthase/poly-beta-1,6-N-acetylglucosamine synthase-like glycosyltransferase